MLYHDVDGDDDRMSSNSGEREEAGDVVQNYGDLHRKEKGVEDYACW